MSHHTTRVSNTLDARQFFPSLILPPWPCYQSQREGQIEIWIVDTHGWCVVSACLNRQNGWRGKKDKDWLAVSVHYVTARTEKKTRMLHCHSWKSIKSTYTHAFSHPLIHLLTHYISVCALGSASCPLFSLGGSCVYRGTSVTEMRLSRVCVYGV